MENEWGRELPTFYKGGQTYVLGGLSERYNLRVRNHTGTRVEAVITVDGRDVISGAVGDTGERGYLVDAYGEVLVEGFRKTFDEVAAFRFSSPGSSYSARMGTPENVGVIGVAVFPERPRQRPQPIARPRPEPRRYEYSYEGGPRRMSERSAGNLGTAQPSAAAPADAKKDKSSAESRADATERSRGAGRSSSGDSYYEYEPPPSYAPSPSTDNLGTEYGESLGSEAREVAFVRANAKRPSAVLTVRYDDVEGLEARGIEVYRRRPIAQASPDPFPRNRFAPPPP